MSGTQQMQPQAFDPRLVTVEVEVSGKLTSFDQSAYIKAKGCKFANAMQNECSVEIDNLDEPTRNYLLTETSPFNQNRTPKLLNLKAGRVSTGLFLVYTGHITTTAISQPPDIKLKLTCKTLHFNKGKVGRRSGGKSSKLSGLAGAIAGNLGLSLRMEAPDMNVANYAHSGNDLEEVDKLGEAGNCQCYVDDQHLILKLAPLPLSGVAVDVNAQTGMVGIPEITEQGLKVKFMYSSAVKLGCALNITSKLNPAANGLFVVFKLNFEIDSRDTAFYYIAECVKAKT